MIVNFGILILVKNGLSLIIGDKSKALEINETESKEAFSDFTNWNTESCGWYEVIYIGLLKFTSSISEIFIVVILGEEGVNLTSILLFT